MKIRTAFVSNSSSSSFLIGLPEKPESKEHFIELFCANIDDEETVNLIWQKYNDCITNLSYSKDGEINIDSFYHHYITILFENSDTERIYDYIKTHKANYDEYEKIQCDNISYYIPIIKDLFKNYYVIEIQLKNNGSNSLEAELQYGGLLFFVADKYLPMLKISEH